MVLLQIRQYTIIGGMPEIANNYVENRDLTILKTLYDGLMVSYLDDVEKYAHNASMVNVIRYIIGNAFHFAGERITFEGFGNSIFRSREIGDAFRVLEKTMIIQLNMRKWGLSPLNPDSICHPINCTKNTI